MMDTDELGQCPCGMQGVWTEHGKRWQSRTREVTVTQQGETHKSTWTWHDGIGQAAGSKGHCHTTGADSHNPDGSPKGRRRMSDETYRRAKAWFER